MMHMYPPLAAISLVEWNTLADYARQHDSEKGTTDLDCYDAHALDVIQVLTIRPDQSGPARMGAVRVMYAPDRAGGIHEQSLTPAQFTHPLPPKSTHTFTLYTVEKRSLSESLMDHSPSTRRKTKPRPCPSEKPHSLSGILPHGDRTKPDIVHS
jgi:hypothetical protein